MSGSKPEFHLRRVTADGEVGPVEVFPVHALPSSAQMGRRGFLGTGVAVASVLGMIGGCGNKQDADALTEARRRREADEVRERAEHERGQREWEDRLKKGEGEKSTPRVGSTVNAHTGFVLALAVTPDGKVLVSGSLDRTVKVRSIPDGKLLHTMGSWGAEVRSVVMTPDGAILAVGDAAGVITLWEVATGKRLGYLFDPAASPTHAVVVTGRGGDARIAPLLRDARERPWFVRYGVA